MQIKKNIYLCRAVRVVAHCKTSNNSFHNLKFWLVNGKVRYFYRAFFLYINFPFFWYAYCIFIAVNSNHEQ